MKSSKKVPPMALVRKDALDDVLCDLFVLTDLLNKISSPEDEDNSVSGIRYFLEKTTRKLDKLTTKAHNVRWGV